MKVVPFWEILAVGEGNIEQQWLPPPAAIDDVSKEAARSIADWLVDYSNIKYGIFVNWLVKLPGFMHCSEFVDAVLWRAGLGTGRKDRTTPCDLYRVYTETTSESQVS